MRWTAGGCVLGAVLALCFSSCTCGRQAPEVPPPRVARRASPPQHPRPRAPERRRLDLERARPDVPRKAHPTLPPPQIGDVEIPADFPEDVPIPEGAETYAVQQLAGDAKNVILKTDRDRPELYHTYRDQLLERGWKVEQEYDGRDQSFLSFRRGNMVTNVIITTEPSTGKRIVAIMYQEEKPLPFEEF